MGGSPSYKRHPTAHDTQPPPQNSTQREGGGEGTPPGPPGAHGGHSKSTQQSPGSAPLAGTGGWGGQGGVRGGCSSQNAGGKSSRESTRGRGDPQPHEAQRGAESGRGLVGAQGSNWGPTGSPAVPVLPRRLRGRGLHPSLVGFGALGTPQPGGLELEPPSLPSLTTHRKQQNQLGNTRHANQEGGSSPPPLPGEVRGEG